MNCCWRSYDCDIIMYGKGMYKDCPCRDCLIKTICSSVCDKMNDFYKKIFGFNHEEYNQQ